MRGRVVRRFGVFRGVSRVSTYSNVMHFFALLLVPIASRSSVTQKISERADTQIWYLDPRLVIVVASPSKHFRQTGKSLIHSYHNWGYHYISIPLYHFIDLLGIAATPYRCSREARELRSHCIHRVTVAMRITTSMVDQDCSQRATTAGIVPGARALNAPHERLVRISRSHS